MHLRASNSKIFGGACPRTPLAWLHACGARIRAFDAQLCFSLSDIHTEGESPYFKIYRLEPLLTKLTIYDLCVVDAIKNEIEYPYN